MWTFYFLPLNSGYTTPQNANSEGKAESNVEDCGTFGRPSIILARGLRGPVHPGWDTDGVAGEEKTGDQ